MPLELIVKDNNDTNKNISHIANVTVQKIYNIIHNTETELNQLPEYKKYDLYKNNRKKIDAIISKVKAQHHLHNYDYTVRQYWLFVICNRAKMWGISKSETKAIASDLREYFDSVLEGDDKITDYHFELAMTGYDEARKISNDRIEEVTGTNISLGNKREYKNILSKIVKVEEHHRRLVLLKRYVYQKKYSVPKIIEMLDKQGLKISKTKLYTDERYRYIMFKCKKRGNKIYPPKT